jgi:hypothetical protein
VPDHPSRRRCRRRTSARTGVMRPTIRLQWATRQIDAVDAEVAQEKAASLRRAYDRLERALAQLHRHDDRSRAAPSSSPPAKSRAELVADAAGSLVLRGAARGLRPERQRSRPAGAGRTGGGPATNGSKGTSEVLIVSSGSWVGGRSQLRGHCAGLGSTQNPGLTIDASRSAVSFHPCAALVSASRPGGAP